MQTFLMNAMPTIDQIADLIRSHRCYSHPIFEHWAEVRPDPRTVGALFHQIQMFCASTRPGGNFPDALRTHGMQQESHLLDEIVESEEDHGPELATMAGHIVNRAAGERVIGSLDDQAAVEAWLKRCSDELLGALPGYCSDSGLTPQARRAIAVMSRRSATDRDSTFRNLGTALALEIISNRQLIPGEKHCLIDSGVYGTTIDEPEMHYLLEHWGEIGAEQQHEKNAMAAVDSVLAANTEAPIREGAQDFLDALAALWDVLDASLLRSGIREDTAVGAGVA